MKILKIKSLILKRKKEGRREGGKEGGKEKKGRKGKGKKFRKIDF